MAIYLTKLFNKKAKKLKITTDTLLKAASEVMNGVFEADLGGGVIKKRVPLKGTGKSGGTRTIIFFKSGTNLFFSMAGQKVKSAEKELRKSRTMTWRVTKTLPQNF